MAVVGIFTLSYMELIIFSDFQKQISRIQCHLEQDKQQLKPSYIISVNYQDFSRSMLSLILGLEQILSQTKLLTLEELQVESQVLRATIYFILYEHFSKFFLFKVNTSTHFLFDFLFFVLTESKQKLFIWFLSFVVILQS